MDKLEPVLRRYPSHMLKIIALPINKGCVWFVDIDLDFFCLEQNRFERNKMIHLISNQLQYVRNKEPNEIENQSKYSEEYDHHDCPGGIFSIRNIAVA